MNTGATFTDFVGTRYDDPTVCGTETVQTATSGNMIVSINYANDAITVSQVEMICFPAS
jgi:hypothetical protein